MTYSHLSVSWDAYQKNICKGFGALQQRGEFVDMTIAAEGHHVKVHQIIMSLVSPYIKELITSAQCTHPIIFLNKVSYQTMQSILEYAYTGEVVVRQDRLGEFLEACKDLQVKGLENTMKFAEATVNEMYTHIEVTREVEGDDNSRVVHSETVDADDKELADDIADSFYHTDNDDDDDDENGETKIHIRDKKNTSVNKSPSFQYSLSNQANLQIVLNRFLYSLRHTRKNDQRFWRCISQQVTRCPAYVATKGDKILERTHAHNHPFHDRQILKRVRNGNVFTALNEVEEAATAARKQKRKVADTEEVLHQPMSKKRQEDEECYSDS